MKLSTFPLAIILITTAISINGWQSSAQMGDMKHNIGEMELGTADANIDLRFIDGMIPHHQGAIAMSKAAFQKSKRPEIKKLATEIIKAQKTEIIQMQNWRKSWYPKASSTPMAWSRCRAFGRFCCWPPCCWPARLNISSSNRFGAVPVAWRAWPCRPGRRWRSRLACFAQPG